MKLQQVLFLLLLLISTNTSHALLLDIDNGELLGASNIEIDGILYNVSFREGTCIELFNDCDETLDFLFQDKASANKASLALLSSVFSTSSFDDDPALTFGCESSDICTIWTPYDISTNIVLTSVMYNYSTTSILIDGFSNLDTVTRPVDMSLSTTATFAAWSLATPVVAPSTFALMCIGLLGLGFKFQRYRN